MERQTYSVLEVAELLGISRNSAYAAIQAGEIPSCRFGRRLVVPKAGVDRLLCEGGAGHDEHRGNGGQSQAAGGQ